jgi:signal transduction histidine kinase
VPDGTGPSCRIGRGQPRLPVVTDAVERHLDAAERWLVRDDGRAVLVDGWEDGHPFCATVCTTDVGLAFCRACPRAIVEHVATRGGAARGACPAGVGLLAFRVPRGGAGVGLLRVSAPGPMAAAAVAEETRIPTATLRRAARDAADASPPDARAVLAAARWLRDPVTLLDWRAAQRDRGADRGRTATAALAQMIATSEEFQDLYRQAESQRRALERSRRQVDRLAREQVRATDEERARIGHQIHDTAAQSMVSAFRFLDAARASADRAAETGVDLPPGLVQNLEAATDRVHAAIREVRGVLAQLVPPGLEELGLTPPIRQRLEALTAGTEIRGEVRGEIPRLDRPVEQTLHNIVAEALSNAVRHGRPSTLLVDLHEERDRAVIVVTDDGGGFDPSSTRRTAEGGLGLLGITRQASWLGGRATIRSRRGHGTQLRISVPIARHRSGGSG